MRYIIPITLIVLLSFTQIFYIPLSALSFKYNRDYIARNLCINKTNPKSNCKGCCYLKKEIEQNTPATNNNQREEISIKSIAFESINRIQLPQHTNIVLCSYPPLNHYFYLRVQNLIKPPEVLSV